MSSPATDQIQLDPTNVQAALNARYVQLVSQLVQENAHLEAYVKQLTARIAELEGHPASDAWGDQTGRP